MSAAEYQAYLASMAAYSSMSAASMGMGTYGGLAGMGLNPMYLASMGMLPGMAGLTPEDEDKSDGKDRKKDSARSMEEAAAAQQAALAQYMYNPMMMQQMMAVQSMGLSAGGLPGNYASLMNAHAAAAAGLTNGSMEDGEVLGNKSVHHKEQKERHKDRHRGGHKEHHRDGHREQSREGHRGPSWEGHRESYGDYQKRMDVHREDKHREHTSDYHHMDHQHERHKDYRDYKAVTPDIKHKEHSKHVDTESVTNNVQDLSARKSRKSSTPVRRTSSIDDHAMDTNDHGLDLTVSSKKPEVST